MTRDNNPGSADHGARPLSLGLLLFGTALAVVVRLVPHPFNFTPVGALGLYGGARLRSWQALPLPLVPMALSDFTLWAVLRYPPFNPFVYASFAVYVLLGRFLLSRTNSPLRIAATTAVGSLQFFLVTNFGVWLGSPTYPQTLEGLVACYAFA